MKPIALFLGGLAALVVAGCGGGSDDPPETFLQVETSPASPYAGDPVTITVGAHNPEVAILEVSIDFTDDGVWDDTREFDERGISATFSYVYANPGTYTVRVDATDRNGTTVSRSEAVTVLVAPLTTPVKYVVQGVSRLGGNCFAADSPVTCDGCALLVGTSTPLPETRSLGNVRRGTQVVVDQGFRQLPLITGNQTYSCQFLVHLFAGQPGSERPFGSGACETTSQSSPMVLECQIVAAGVVP